ncbi:hypothetical protein ABZ504_53955, partial [Streptomyces mirabilis]
AAGTPRVADDRAPDGRPAAGPLSAEAAAARAAYEGTAHLTRAVAAGVSGRELATRGFVQDVAIATEGDICAAVPVRDGDGAFSPG